MTVLEFQQHDQRYDRTITDNADTSAEQCLDRSVERGQFDHLSGGRAGQPERGQSRIPTGCGQAGRGARKRNERNDEHQASERGQYYIAVRIGVHNRRGTFGGPTRSRCGDEHAHRKRN